MSTVQFAKSETDKYITITIDDVSAVFNMDVLASFLDAGPEIDYIYGPNLIEELQEE